MRMSQNPTDMISQAIINQYLGRDFDESLTEEEYKGLAFISQLTPEQAFEHIVMRYELNTRREEIAYLQALHQQVVSFCASKVADIQLFLKEWDESGSSEALVVEKGESTIELTTIHKAKGLERKVIIIPSCNWALKPMSRSTIWATPSDGNEKDELADIGRFPVGAEFADQCVRRLYAFLYKTFSFGRFRRNCRPIRHGERDWLELYQACHGR